MKNLLLIFLVFSTIFCKAQDSTTAGPNEIGFNTVSLVKQLISNNPTSTLATLPYMVFYNYYFTDNMAARLGVGGSISKNEQNIQGQVEPRTTKVNAVNLRLGASVNLAESRRVTVLGFADFIYEKGSTSTINTSTIQTFPNPIINRRVESSTKTNGFGGQIGAGLKFGLYKHLSLYVEVPMSYIIEKTETSDTVTDVGSPAVNNTATETNTNIRISLPTTLYLILKF